MAVSSTSGCSEVDEILSSACDTGKFEVVHPMLNVPMCKRCLKKYIGEFTVVEGHEMYCRWCGEGKGELYLCDTCIKAFCQGCVNRNFGSSEIEKVKSSETWECYVCSPHLLDDLLRTRGWNSLSEKKPVRTRSLNYLVHQDISNGAETLKIPAYNEFDDEKFPTESFTYVAKYIPGENVTLDRNPNFLSCCDCAGPCCDIKKCACLRTMKGTAYNHLGLLVDYKNVAIYECNYCCSCNPKQCLNRVVGSGIKLPLQVFRCADGRKGWGLRCSKDIIAGSFICEYGGEILTEKDAERIGVEKGDEYLFTLDAWTRSCGYQRLDDLGLKDSYILTHARDVELDWSSPMTLADFRDVVGEVLFQRYLQRGLLPPSGSVNIGYMLDISSTDDVESVDEPAGKRARGGDFSTMDDGENRRRTGSVNGNGVENAQSSSAATRTRRTYIRRRLEARTRAMDIIMDRVSAALENQQTTYCVDAK